MTNKPNPYGLPLHMLNETDEEYKRGMERAAQFSRDNPNLASDIGREFWGERKEKQAKKKEEEKRAKMEEKEERKRREIKLKKEEVDCSKKVALAKKPKKVSVTHVTEKEIRQFLLLVINDEDSDRINILEYTAYCPCSVEDLLNKAKFIAKSDEAMRVHLITLKEAIYVKVLQYVKNNKVTQAQYSILFASYEKTFNDIAEMTQSYEGEHESETIKEHSDQEVVDDNIVSMFSLD